MATKDGVFRQGLIQIADPKIWIASTIPMAAGAAIAWSFSNKFEPLSILWFVLAACGVYLVETAKNALNEMVDYISGADPGVDQEHRTPFSGGKKTIVEGKLTLTQCLNIALACFAVAAVLGILLTVFVRPAIFFIGLAGFVLSVLYSLPPFKFCYRGLGEIAVGIAFGPVILLGIHVLITGTMSLFAFIASLPVAFMIMNVLVINQFPDYETDKEHGKKNWVVRLGKKRSVVLYAALFALSYGASAATAFIARNPVWLLFWLTVPLAIKAVKNCSKNYNNIRELTASNAATVLIYQLLGVCLVAGAVLDGAAF